MSAPPPLPTTRLPSGESVPALGQGTWGMGERASARPDEVAALRFGLELGMALIDTAEMYGDGGAEEVVGETIEGRRDSVFLVSKVLPSNASCRSTVAACERSLRRLKTDRLDLYLLHWRGGTPFADTIAAFEQLKRDGKILHWGVSNLDLADMKELVAAHGGGNVATNQVLYNLTRRGIEYGLLPWSRQRRIPIMAYSPIEQGRILSDPTLRAVAARHNAAPAQIALAWLTRQDGLIVIPKATHIEHVRQNRAAIGLRLTKADLTELDRAFPPPAGPQALEML